MSKTRVFGSQVYITVDGKYIAEITSLDQRSDNVVKKSSSLGEAGVGTISVLDNGGTIDIEVEKSDSKLLGMFLTQESQMRGGGIAGKRGEAPYFEIVEETTYPDLSIEKVIYEGAKLHSPSHSVNGSTEVVGERFTVDYKRRTATVIGTEAKDSASAGKTYVKSAIKNYKEKQGAIKTSMIESAISELLLDSELTTG